MGKRVRNEKFNLFLAKATTKLDGKSFVKEKSVGIQMNHNVSKIIFYKKHSELCQTSVRVVKCNHKIILQSAEKILEIKTKSGYLHNLDNRDIT